MEISQVDTVAQPRLPACEVAQLRSTEFPSQLMILQTKINVYFYVLLRFCGCLFCSIIMAINNGYSLLSKKIFLLTAYLVENH